MLTLAASKTVFGVKEKRYASLTRIALPERRDGWARNGVGVALNFTYRTRRECNTRGMYEFLE